LKPFEILKFGFAANGSKLNENQNDPTEMRAQVQAACGADGTGQPPESCIRIKKPIGLCAIKREGTAQKLGKLAKEAIQQEIQKVMTWALIDDETGATISQTALTSSNLT
jgi:hypothetical protein